MVRLSITSPLDLGIGRPAGTELSDLFTPVVTHLDCIDDGTIMCSANITDYEGINNLTDALNEIILPGKFYEGVDNPYQLFLLILNAESLAEDLPAYQFDVTILLNDGKSFELSTGEIRVR